MAARNMLPAVFYIGMALSPAANAGEPDAAPRLDGACQQLMDTAAHLNAQLQRVQLQLSQALTASGAELARELAPAMRRAGDRLQALAQQLERSRTDSRGSTISE